MVKDAELNKDRDEKKRTMIEAKNEAQSLCDYSKKELTGDNAKFVTEDLKKELEAEISALEGLISQPGSTTEVLKGGIKKLNDALMKAFSGAYKQQPGGGGPEGGAAGGKGDVPEAEYTEVNDKK